MTTLSEYYATVTTLAKLDEWNDVVRQYHSMMCTIDNWLSDYSSEDGDSELYYGLEVLSRNISSYIFAVTGKIRDWAKRVDNKSDAVKECEQIIEFPDHCVKVATEVDDFLASLMEQAKNQQHYERMFEQLYDSNETIKQLLNKVKQNTLDANLLELATNINQYLTWSKHSELNKAWSKAEEDTVKEYINELYTLTDNAITAHKYVPNDLLKLRQKVHARGELNKFGFTPMSSALEKDKGRIVEESDIDAFVGDLVDAELQRINSLKIMLNEYIAPDDMPYLNSEIEQYKQVLDRLADAVIKFRDRIISEWINVLES